MQRKALQDLFPRPDEIPAEHRLAAAIYQGHHLVDGRLEPCDGALKAVLSPVCVQAAGELPRQVEIGSYRLMSETQTDAVLAAAVDAYDNGRGEWPTMDVAGRIACMQEFVRKMVAQRERVVRLIMWEIGKSLADSRKEFDRTVEYIAATIEALKDLDNGSSRFEIAEGTIGQNTGPLGVVLCMGPYNYPLNETFATLIPALLMGTRGVQAPAVRHAAVRALARGLCSAFPKGVINTVYAPGQVVVPRMLGSGQINVLALIGSSKVADHLKRQHPKSHRLRAILGLDAKNAAIVLPDADLELAVKECLLGALSFNGQRCTALKMLIVHRDIVERFLQRFTEELAKLKVGMPWEPGVSITPLPGLHRTAYMTEALDDAKDQGARVVNAGGGSFCQTLYYPAVVYPVREGMKLYREEQFGRSSR